MSIYPQIVPGKYSYSYDDMDSAEEQIRRNVPGVVIERWHDFGFGMIASNATGDRRWSVFYPERNSPPDILAGIAFLNG